MSNSQYYFIYSIPSNEEKFYTIRIKNTQKTFTAVTMNEATTNNITFLIQLYYVTAEELNSPIVLSLVSNLRENFDSNPLTLIDKSFHFLFNVTFNESHINSIYKSPPVHFPIGISSQVKYFMTYVKDMNLSNVIKDKLIQDSIKMIETNTNVKLTYLFFFTLLNECYFNNTGLKIVQLLELPLFETKFSDEQNIYMEMINEIKKPDCFLRNKINDVLTSTKLTVNLNRFILSYYFYCKRSSFLTYLHDDPNQKELIKLILKHNFKGLNEQELSAILVFLNNQEDIIKLIQLSENINVFLEFIIKNKSQLNKLVNKSKFDLSIFLSSNETNDMNDILDTISIIKENTKDYAFIKVGRHRIITHYINLYENYNFQGLKIIQEYLKRNERMEHKNTCIEKVDKAIHSLGFKLINKSEFKSNDILFYIMYDSLLNTFKYEEIELIGKQINLEQIDETFIDFFDSFYLEKTLHYKYEILLKNILDSLKSLNTFTIVTKLFPSESLSNMVCTKLMDRFANILREEKEINNDVLYSIILSFFQNLLKAKLIYIINDLRVILQNHLPIETLINLYVRLSQEIENQKIKNNLIEYIASKLNDQSADNICRIIFLINNESALKSLFNYLTLLVKPDEFFEYPETNNLQLLQQLINYGYFMGNYSFLQGSEYYRTTYNTIKNVKKTMDTLGFYPNVILKFSDKKEELKKRIQLAFFEESQKKQQQVYNKIIDALQYLETLKKDMNEIITYVNFFYKKNNDYLKAVLGLNNAYINNLVIYTIQNKHLFSFIGEHLKNAQTYNKYLNSQFFLSIYNYHHQFDDASRKEKTKTIFNSLKGLFTNPTDYIENNNDIIDLLFKEDKDLKYFMKEIQTLKTFFNLTDETDHEDSLENIIMLAKKSSYMKKLAHVISFITQFNAERTKFSGDLHNYYNSMNDNWDFEQINSWRNNQSINILKLDNEDDSKSSYDILSIIHNRKELITFMIQTKEDDVRELNNFIDGVDNACIKEETIQDLVKVVQFVFQLHVNKPNDKQLVELLFKQCKEKKYAEMNVYFKSVSDNFIEIKDLYAKVLNNEEFSKDKIIQIYQESQFIIKLNETDKKYECMISYKRKQIEKNCSFADILELRDKSLLLSKKQEDLKDDKQITFYKQCQLFSNVVDSINSLMNDVIKLTDKGYPEDFNITIKVNNQEIKAVYLKCEYNITDLKKEINQKLETFDREQHEAYTYYPFMTFVYGKQFSHLVNHLKNQKTDITHFLKFFTNNKYQNKILCVYTQESGEICKDLILKSNSFLEQIANANHVTLATIYENNIIQNKQFKGIYTFLVAAEEIENQVISSYYLLTNNYPMAQTVLLCTDTTSIEEINAFMYRSIKCNLNVLFFIINPENLELEKRKKITLFLEEEYSQICTTIKSTLVFLYSDKTSDLIEFIRRLSGSQPFSSIKRDDFQTLKEATNIEIVSSDAAGVGKSTQIELEANKKNKQYIYFPIGGEFTRERIVERLIKHSFRDNQTVLHLDLMDTKQISLMKDFLFSLLITKWYYAENIFYLGNNIEIKIEIPFGFIDFFQKFPILKLFKNREISINTLPPLIISNDITSNIQVVCNYLNIDDNTLISNNIYIPGISTEFTDNKCKIEIKPLTKEQCDAKIKQYFTIQHPTYYQIKSFIDVLGNQFKCFSQCYYIEVDLLKNNGQVKNQNILSVRSSMRNALIKITQYFTKGAYSNLITNQNSSYEYQSDKYNENEVTQKAIAQLSNKEVVSFDKISPSLVFFNEDKSSFSIISTSNPDTEEYKELMRLWNSWQEKTDNHLIDYKTIDRKEFLTQVKKILDIRNPVLIDMEYTDDNRLSIERIADSYVFTADNFIKMILILLRIRANIPAIMMGETGCGKTSLIRMISSLVDNRMKILNIHAGINEEDIINFMKKEVFTELSNNPQKSIWVFLDEINTCHSMGLISEMMCKHSMEGEKLSDKIIFIAACNPYRLIKHQIVHVGLALKGKSIRNLVYNVNPLPHSLLNFVFDFGTLTEEDEKRYIESMISLPIEQCFRKANMKQNSTQIQNIKNQAIKAITLSQKFIRDNNDVSSVSLREVRRFVIFYEWFSDFLFKKQQKLEAKGNPTVDFEAIQLNAVILSIYLCYYLRLPQKEIRKAYRKFIKEILGKQFSTVTKQELKELIDKIKPPIGIAKNRALKENLFTLFVCVNNKIPVFICGKPGCSKSLSVQLLFKAMKGDTSEDDFFKPLPRLFMNNYQGSLTSTSKGVLSIFQKARHIIQNIKDQNMISMVYFDEMGLAEISKNNPLKVIHSQLEYDENKDKVAFVGISNWVLDASKMNRGVFLSIPDPDEDDLIETANSIASSYDDELITLHKDIFDYLARTYYEYKALLQKNHGLYKDFHGSRDFYHLIKNASNNIKKNKNSMTKDRKDLISIEAIERNFGGLEFSMKEIKGILFKKVSSGKSIDEYNVMKCVQENINDRESRYLIIISKASLSPFLLNNILKTLEKSFSFYIGSQFNDDMNEEYYGIKILNKIQHCMEQGKVLILKNLETIYPSLYDVFNQNFNVVGDKSYARIALGSTNSPMALVNKDFRCVILLDQDEIHKQDPPFLNRFEKHIVSFEYLLSPELMKFSKEINEIINDLVTPSNKTFQTKVNLKKQLISCDLEEIQGIIYINQKKGIDREKISEEFLKKVAPTFSQDIIGFMDYSLFKSKYINLYEKILSIYKQGSHKNLGQYLERLDNTKNVIFTFSNILEKISISKAIDSVKIGEINHKMIVEIMVSSVKSENEIDNLINEIYINKDKKICIFKFSPSNCHHMNHIKFLVENYETDNEKRAKKIFIFMVHLYREYNNTNSIKEHEETLNHKDLISHLADYSQVFIDNINGGDILITELLSKTNKELYSDTKLIDYNKLYQDNLFPSFMLLKEDYLNSQLINNENRNCIQIMLDNPFISENIIKCILSHIEKEKSIIDTVFFNYTAERNDDSITSIKRHMEELFKDYLAKIIFKIENDSVLSDCTNLDNNDEIKACFLDYIQNVQVENIKLKKGADSNPVNKILGLNIPGSKDAFEKLLIYVKSVQDDFENNEDSLRKELFSDEDEEIKEIINEFYRKQNDLINDVVNEMDKISLLHLLKVKVKSEQLSIKTQEDLENDYLIFFLINHFKQSNPNLLHYLKRLLRIRFSQINSSNSFVQLSATILWLESNILIFKILIDSFIILNGFISNISDAMNYIIDKKLIVFEKSSRNPQYKEEINNAFFFGIELLLKTSVRAIDLNILNDNKFFDLLNCLKTLNQSSTQMGLILWFPSKEQIFITSFIYYYECLSVNDMATKDTLALFFERTKQEEEMLVKKDTDGLITHLDKEMTLLQSLVGNKNNYAKMIITILIGKYKQYSNEEYRLVIIKYVIANNELIQESKPLLLYYFNCYMIQPFTIDKENTEEELVDRFIDFKDNTDDKPLVLLNQTTNPILIEVLMCFFQQKINLLFINQPEDGFIIFGIALKYFNASLDYVESVLSNNNNDSLKQLTLWYCICYIKVYLYYYVSLLKTPKENIRDMKEINKINKIICERNHKAFIKILKIYILKLFRKYTKSFDELKELPWPKYQINWITEFHFEEDKASLDFSFVSVIREADYKIMFTECSMQQFKSETKSIIKLIDEKGIMIFFDITINQILSNLLKSNYVNNPNYIDFSFWVNKITKKISLKNKSKDVLSLYYNSETFIKNVYPKLTGLSFNLFEILLYSYKICFICAEMTNSWYNKLLSSDLMKIIQKSYIPGGEITDNPFVKSAFEIEYHFKQNGNNVGVYICSCGVWYQIENCKRPWVKSKCYNCQLEIGGERHKIVKRKGHNRVYPDLNMKDQEDDPDALITVAQLKENAMKIINNLPKGIIQVPDIYFMNNRKEVRNLDHITYRLLSFMLYSVIYYANLLKYVNDSDVQKLLITQTTCLNHIERNWNILKDALNKVGINNIQIFFQMIFDDIKDVIQNHYDLDTNDMRLRLEKEMNEMIKKKINEYQSYNEKYKNVNNRLFKVNPLSMKSLIHELENHKMYSETDYPLYKYFMVEDYAGMKSLMMKLEAIPDYQSKYPVLNNCITQKYEIKPLGNILLINPLANYMINHYSYNITRDQGKELLIEKEIKQLNNRSVNAMYANYIEGWLMIFQNAIKYECKTLPKPKELKENDPIAFFLNDNGELGFGMYLAAAYFYFIELQNNFVQSIIDNIEMSGVGHYFKEFLSKKVYAQDASKYEVISLTIDKENSSYTSFEDLLFSLVNKHCFNSDGSINYLRYQEISYDFDTIESELVKIILPGKKLFHTDQRYVIYGYEGSRGDRSSIIQEYYSKYPQKELSIDEKILLNNYINRQAEEIDKFMFSLQKCIFYIKKSNYQQSTAIFTIINSMPKYINLLPSCKDFFDKNHSFTVNHLITLFEFVEHHCFKSFIENLDSDYLQPLDENIKTKIDAFFKARINKIINRDNFATAIRKLISRKISGKRNDKDIDSDKKLMDYITQEEFWHESIVKNEKFDDEIDEIKSIGNITISQSLEVYFALGGDDASTGAMIEKHNKNSKDKTGNKRRII